MALSHVSQHACGQPGRATIGIVRRTQLSNIGEPALAASNDGIEQLLDQLGCYAERGWRAHSGSTAPRKDVEAEAEMYMAGTRQKRLDGRQGSVNTVSMQGFITDPLSTQLSGTVV